MDLRFLYLIFAFLSLLEVVVFYEISSNKVNKNYFFLSLSALLSNFGYALVTYSSTLEAALLSDSMSYIGSIFTIMFMLIVVVDMCNRRFFFPLRLLLFFCALTFCILVGTTEKTDLFFTQSEISTCYGMTMITHKHGPVMYLYIMYLVIINLTAIIVVINSILKKKKVSKQTLHILLIMLLSGTLAYLIPLFLGINLNFMPFIYVLMELFFIFLSFKVNSYDIPLNLMNVYKTRGNYGYIAFDRKKRFLGCDEFALMLFPELNSIPLDSMIPNSCKAITDKLHYMDEKWNWDTKANQDFKIVSNKKAAICTIHPISASKKNQGYLFELRDDTEQQNYINGINSYNKELSHLIEEKTRQVTDMQDSIIKGMATMIESRDNSTGGHILRTSDCIKIFTDELLKHKEIPQITSNFCRLLVNAAPMHDLGKISVDDSILRKPGKFTSEEYEKMKEHAAEGARIVKKILDKTSDKDFERIAVNVAHYHHEKWNGEGYPEHLHGEEIPLEARIMALADVFDALVSKRCYKDAKSFDDAFDIIKKDLGRHFDPQIGEIFIDCRPQLEKYYCSILQEI